MANVFKKIRGIVGNLFQFGNGDGPNLKNNSNIIEARNAADDAFVLTRGALIPSSGETVNDLVALLDLRGRVADIEFSFDGASAPAPGTNTGKFGFCHTTGGGHTANDVVYDDGASLFKIPFTVVKHLTTRTAITGTTSLNANGVYCYQGGTWTLKGDGAPSNVGLVRAIEVEYDYTDGNVDSTTTVPDGTRVIRCRNVVETAFDDAGATVAVSVNGSTPEAIMATGDSNLDNAAEYHVEDTHLIDSDSEGVVRVAVTPASATQGAGRVILEYLTPSL